MVSKAVIWDMDGVIADTGPFHFEAWQQVARVKGVPFTEADFRQTFGKRNREIIAEKFGKKLSSREMDSIAQRKEYIFRMIAGRSVIPFPGALHLLRSLNEAGWKMAVASSTTIENIELITQTLDIAGFFDAMVSDREVSRGKPDPEVFLVAAKKLKVEPGRCIVIENAVDGIKAAKKAKMKCIAVTTTNPPARVAEADLIVDRLERVTVGTLESLLE